MLGVEHPKSKTDADAKTPAWRTSRTTTEKTQKCGRSHEEADSKPAVQSEAEAPEF